MGRNFSRVNKQLSEADDAVLSKRVLHRYSQLGRKLAECRSQLRRIRPVTESSSSVRLAALWAAWRM